MMVSFGDFFEILEFEKKIKECASLMSESEKEPEQIIEGVLEEDILENWKSWLGKAGAAAGQVASGVAGGIASGVASGIASGGQRMIQGARQAQDTMSGPLAKFKHAVDTLEELEKMLRSNPATKGVRSRTNPERSIAGYIQSIKINLEKEKTSIPQMVGSSRFPHEDPTKYLRGGQIQARNDMRNRQSGQQSNQQQSGQQSNQQQSGQQGQQRQQQQSGQQGQQQQNPSMRLAQ
jgi:hypothetical protein